MIVGTNNAPPVKEQMVRYQGNGKYTHVYRYARTKIYNTQLCATYRMTWLTHGGPQDRTLRALRAQLSRPEVPRYAPT